MEQANNTNRQLGIGHNSGEQEPLGITNEIERVKRRINKVTKEVGQYKNALCNFLKPSKLKPRFIENNLNDIIDMFLDNPKEIDMHIAFFTGILKTGVDNSDKESNKLINEAGEKLKNLLLAIRGD